MLSELDPKDQERIKEIIYEFAIADANHDVSKIAIPIITALIFVIFSCFSFLFVFSILTFNIGAIIIWIIGAIVSKCETKNYFKKLDNIESELAEFGVILVDNSDEEE